MRVVRTVRPATLLPGPTGADARRRLGRDVRARDGPRRRRPSRGSTGCRPVRVRPNRPCSLWPSTTNETWSGSSRSTSTVPSSQMITAPLPRPDPSCTPSNSPADRVVVRDLHGQAPQSGIHRRARGERPTTAGPRPSRAAGRSAGAWRRGAARRSGVRRRSPASSVRRLHRLEHGAHLPVHQVDGLQRADHHPDLDDAALVVAADDVDAVDVLALDAWSRTRARRCRPTSTCFV